MSSLKINNRRYVGSKTKLLPLILQEAYKAMGTDTFSLADLFGGTGVVAYAFAKRNHPVIVNDILLSNVVAYTAWMGKEPIRDGEIERILHHLNSITYDEIHDNYFSQVYGGKYFSNNDAKKIGFIRDYIENLRPQLQYREYCYLLTSLLYITDKIANTVGHFEYFLNCQAPDTYFQLPKLELSSIAPAQIYNEDANALSKQISADVVYLDPPYNARQYINFYHVLENLVRWEKPTEFEGKSMKFKRNHLKSGYSRSEAPILFKDLVSSLQCKVIMVSYNNTYNAKSEASNNKIKEQELIDILSEKGDTTKIEVVYPSFNAGKTHFENHKEYLFICHVK